MGFALADAAQQPPDRTDIEGWRSVIKAGDEAVIGFVAMVPAVPASSVDVLTIDGVTVFDLMPDGVPDDPDGPIYFDIHGGALIMGGGEACRALATKIAAMTRMRTWSVDYRMAPDHPYPAALDDCITVYRRLLELRPPERIVVGGGSAGGNLAAALMLRARDEGLPFPAALVLLTPEADLTESGDSFQTNLGIDCVLQQSLAEMSALYAGDHDLAHPYLSPLFGDYTPPFPPTLLQTGTRDLLLSNAVRLHRKMRTAGVDAELHVFEAMPHGGFYGAPEDNEIGAEMRHFMAKHLPH
jgi:acetyl esterase/lipase